MSGVFATTSVASGLLAQGMSLSQLNPSFGRFRPEIAVNDTVDWNQTRSRLGMRDISEMIATWPVWSGYSKRFGRRGSAFEGTELHLVGTARPRHSGTGRCE